MSVLRVHVRVQASLRPSDPKQDVPNVEPNPARGFIVLKLNRIYFSVNFQL